MQVKVLIKSGAEVDLNYISELSVISTMHNICTSAHIMLNNFALEYFNIIKTGTPVYIMFYDDNNTFINPMRVASYSKIPGKQSEFQDKLELNCIHEFYFYNAMGSKTFGCQNSPGDTVSGIVEEVINTYFKDKFSYTLDATTDHPAKRYQICERAQDFLNRIMKYAQKDFLPAYLYFDNTNTLRLRSIGVAMSESPITALYPLDADNLSTTPSDVKYKRNLALANFKFGADTSQSSSSITSKFTISNFKTTEDLNESITLNGNELYSTQTDMPTPPITVFYGWNKTPSDAIALAARNSFELNSTAYTLSANLNGIYVKEVTPGTVVRVILPYSPVKDNRTGKDVNLGEGNYIITKSIVSLRGSQITTKLHMVFLSA